MNLTTAIACLIAFCLNLDLAAMHQAHGYTPGRTCGRCLHLAQRVIGQPHHLCTRAAPPVVATRLPPWQPSWNACGLFQDKDN